MLVRLISTVIAALTVVVVVTLFGATATAGSELDYPASIVVLGHSGATGYNSNPARRNQDAPENSWATGSNPAVNSVYRRILAHNPSIEDHSYNLAVSGSNIDDMSEQARDALTFHPELVLIQTVDNDMRCDGTDAQNYKPYAAKLARVLGIIAKGAPKAHVFIVSVWSKPLVFAKAVLGLPAAGRADKMGNGICDPLDPTGKLHAAGIAGSGKIIAGYHRQIAATCARFANCRYDHGAAYRMVIHTADLTPDGNHLSIQGQKKMAAAVWAALY
jgi:lysophospholipase L1-like esterase